MIKNFKHVNCLILLIFILGLLFMVTNKPKSIMEGFKKHDCPDILIQKGKHLVLYNSRLADIPGINPVKFNNLEDYVEYVKWQRSQKINCPVLFLQHSYDVQGNSVYKNRPSPMELEGGLPIISGLDMAGETTNKSLLLDATRNNPPYNKNSYPGFDPLNQNIGLNTPLDKIFHADAGGVSPNPMDPNWGGPGYTEKLVDEGYYKEENVKIFIPD